ncbi:MAG TPA: NAD-dependent epimerase/dehydratase family protein [Acidimicrobiia bacterium]|nr:NAD-dependent epimerase/dehydratase family protein [Acidimicrobiia bacterium]
MRVGVTGGSGVVGRALVRHLIDAGHQVVALARTPDSAADLRVRGATPVDGDVLDPPGLRALVEGKDWVFHVAGINEMCSPDPDLMDLVNIEGTRNVMEACRSAGVGRMIHTSSAAAIGEAHGTIGSESTPHRGSYLSRYERSKHLAERVLFDQAGDLEVVAVNPSSVQGPGRATGTGKLILDLVNGRLPFLVETTVSMVDIDDCARGHVLAAERGRFGQRYILNGSSSSISEVVDLFNAITGRDLAPRFVPGWMASGGAAAIEIGGRIGGRRPPVCREMVRVLRAGHTYDGSRATRDLGLEYTPLESTIARTVDWFRAQGLLV